MCVLLAGRAAEEEFFGEISSGAQDDLEKVTDLAYAYVTKYGMSTLGNIAYSDNAGRGMIREPITINPCTRNLLVLTRFQSTLANRILKIRLSLLTPK